MPSRTLNRKISDHPFSTWLYGVIVANDLTLDEVAEAASISRANLSEMMSNHCPNPKIDTLKRLSVALGVNLRTLVSKFEDKQ